MIRATVGREADAYSDGYNVGLREATEAERKAVVEWLRRKSDADPCIDQLFKDFADAIEAGEHRRTP